MARFARFSYKKPLAVAAIALGLTAGGYGVAAAASSSSASSTAATAPAATATAAATAPTSGPPGATAQNPWGNQRSDETSLTGDTLAGVKAAVLAEVGSDATIVRIETDADGNGAYEAHIVKADGTPVTVYTDTSFKVLSVDSGSSAPTSSPSSTETTSPTS
jgi:hypothetical protein